VNGVNYDCGLVNEGCMTACDFAACAMNAHVGEYIQMTGLFKCMNAIAARGGSSQEKGLDYLSTQQ